MEPATLVSVEDYLDTSYGDGDREYVDGRIVERNVGEVDHGDLQTAIATYLRTRYHGKVWTAVNVRVQVKKTRFRVPDITVVAGVRPAGRIIVDPPLLVIEILSPDDRVCELDEKIEDYLAFGIPNVCTINPRSHRTYMYTQEGVRELKDGVLRISAHAIEVPLSDMFA